MDDYLRSADLVGRLDRWVAAARVDEAAAARAREHWLRTVADESATLAGVLLDLAERGTPVMVQGRGGRRHRGVIVAVGADFAALRSEQDADVLLAFSGVAAVRPDGRQGGPSGDRRATFELAFTEAVAAVAADRPRALLVTTADGDGIAGELRSVGRDVVTVRLDGDAGVAYVPLAAIAELHLV